MGRFFQEHGKLPALVRLVFDAVDQDEVDRLEAAATTRRLRARGNPPPREAKREDSARPAPFLQTLDLRTVGGRALVAGFASGAAGFVLVAWLGVPFQISLLLGLVSVALAVASVPGLPALRHRIVLRRARRQFEVCVSPDVLVVRTGKTVIRQWNLDAVSAVRVERRRLVVDGKDGASRILPIRFVADEDVTGVVDRTRALIKDARAKSEPRSKPKKDAPTSERGSKVRESRGRKGSADGREP